MNKNTKEIVILKESIAELESIIANLKRNKLASKLEIDDRRDGVFETDEKISYIENYIACYNDFKKIVHKPDVFNYFLLFFFLLNISIPIISGTGVFTPVTTSLLYITGLYNIADIFLRHKIEYIHVDTIKEINPFNFNNKYYKKEVERKAQLIEAKEKLLKEIDDLIEINAVCQNLIITAEDKIQSDKEKLHDLIQEKETRNQIIKMKFFEKVSELINFTPEFQETFINEMNEKGFNVELFFEKGLFLGDNITLKLER